LACRLATTVGHHLAIFQLDDPLGLFGDRHVVGHQHQRVALSMQRAQDAEHFGPALAVEGAGRLVRQDHLAAVDEGAGNADPLLLAAGELARLVVEPAAEPESLQQALGPRLACIAGQPGIESGQRHVVAGTEIPQQVVALKDEAEVLAAQGRQRIGRQPACLPSSHPIATLARLIEAAQNVEQGRFAGAGGADDGHHLAPRYGQIDALEHLDAPLPVAKMAADPAQLQQWFPHGHIPIGGPIRPLCWLLAVS